MVLNDQLFSIVDISFSYPNMKINKCFYATAFEGVSKGKVQTMTLTDNESRIETNVNIVFCDE